MSSYLWCLGWNRALPRIHIRYQVPMYTASMRELKKKIWAREGSMCSGKKKARKQLGRFICHSWSQTFSSCLIDFRFLQISQVMSKGRRWHLSPPLAGDFQSCLTLALVCIEDTFVGGPESHSTVQAGEGQVVEVSGKHCSWHTLLWSCWPIVPLKLWSG